MQCAIQCALDIHVQNYDWHCEPRGFFSVGVRGEYVGYPKPTANNMNILGDRLHGNNLLDFEISINTLSFG